MRRSPLLRILAVPILVAAACSSAGSAESPSQPAASPSTAEAAVGVGVGTETLTTPEGTPIDVHSPDGDGPWPVVLFLHGSPPTTMKDVSVIADAIAERGALVYNVGWTDGGLEGVDGSVVNVACAVAFARETASAHGGEEGRITLVGLSAGGWSGAAVALGGEALGSRCAESQSPLPDVFVGISGAYSAAEDGTLESLLADDPDALHAVDPFTYIGENPDLHVWLIHGDADTTQPLAVVKRFRRALLGGGYDTKLVVLAGAGHDIASPDDQDTVLTTIITAARGS